MNSAARPLADVSVVIPAFNRASLIGRAIQSVVTQTVRPVEVIVVDDGSTDGTGETASARGAKVLTLPTNHGISEARNRGIIQATAEWVAFLDSDDAWFPHHLESLLAKSNGMTLVCAPGRDDYGRLIGNPRGYDVQVDARSMLIPGDLVSTSGAMVRRNELLQAGLFRPLPRAEDLDLWIRVLELGRGVVLGDPTFTYHVHGAQSINDVELMRRCYSDVVESYTDRDWFRSRDADRAVARWHWDALRTAQRVSNSRAIAQELLWLIRRPHVWTTLSAKLRERRLSRPGSVA